MSARMYICSFITILSLSFVSGSIRSHGGDLNDCVDHMKKAHLMAESNMKNQEHAKNQYTRSESGMRRGKQFNITRWKIAFAQLLREAPKECKESLKEFEQIHTQRIAGHWDALIADYIEHSITSV